MRRREDQSEPDWLPWLKDVIRARGYDIDSAKSGARTALAHKSGIPESTLSRILTGAGTPNYETCVTLARALQIPLRVMLIRTGKATEQDFSDTATDTQEIAVLSGKRLSPRQLAIAAGIPSGDLEWFETMIRRMRREDRGSDGTEGGAAAEG